MTLMRIIRKTKSNTSIFNRMGNKETKIESIILVGLTILIYSLYEFNC